MWDPNKIGLTAGEVGKMLLEGEPRIMTHAGLTESSEASEMLLRPAAMWPGEYKLVAERLHEILSAAPKSRQKAEYAPPAGDVAGLWESRLEFTVGSARHTFYLDPKGNMLSGQYAGRQVKGPLKGHIDGDKIVFSSGGRIEGASLRYTYQGTFDGKQISGTVDLGEYGAARFIATRRA
jgi:D-glucosaminate-6-phosphate ammonia-lyase